MTDPPGCAIEEAALITAHNEVDQKELELEVAEAAEAAAQIELTECQNS